MTFNETLTDWLSTFWRVLIAPTPKTFLAEAEKGEGKFSSAVAWLVFFAIYIFLFSIVLLQQVLFPALIVAVFVIPACVIIYTSAMHFVHQRIYKRKQYMYDKLLYLTVAVIVPLQLFYIPISAVLLTKSSTTINLILNNGVLLYQVVLLVLSSKTITKLSYWQTIMAILISFAAAALALLCTIPFLMSMIGGVNAVL